MRSRSADITLQSLNCLIGLIESANLVLFIFRNSEVGLNDNFGNNLKNSNARRFLNSYALK